MKPRVVAWFSCGAASAVAAKLAVEKYGDRAVVIYCDTSKDEHPDNARFFSDVQNWIGVPIQVIGSLKYDGIEDVFEKRRYMSGIAGAPCSLELKKIPRMDWQWGDDINVWGYTAEEQSRIAHFKANNPELYMDWILSDRGIGKSYCLSMISDAGIALPVMYLLGYRNNNCIGCVKATSATYWNKIRRDFPDVFARRVAQSRELGARLTRWQGERIFLDELPLSADDGVLDDISCGPECTQGALL